MRINRGSPLRRKLGYMQLNFFSRFESSELQIFDRVRKCHISVKSPAICRLYCILSSIVRLWCDRIRCGQINESPGSKGHRQWFKLAGDRSVSGKRQTTRFSISSPSADSAIFDRQFPADRPEGVCACARHAWGDEHIRLGWHYGHIPLAPCRQSNVAINYN